LCLQVVTLLFFAGFLLRFDDMPPWWKVRKADGVLMATITIFMPIQCLHPRLPQAGTAFRHLASSTHLSAPSVNWAC
jgi:hypothetical protein